MPGLDWEVHRLVKIGANYIWGCWNLPREREKIRVQDGWTEDGRRRMIDIDDFGSIECRNDNSLKDPHCEGCKWRGSGERYDQMVRSRGT